MEEDGGCDVIIFVYMNILWYCFYDMDDCWMSCYYFIDGGWISSFCVIFII